MERGILVLFQSLADILLIVLGVLKMSDFTKQNFIIEANL